MPIPVIDIFAGPGGLGEGFSSFHNENNKRFFNTALSIEKEKFAYETLLLRSFYRQLDHSIDIGDSGVGNFYLFL